MKAFGMYNSKSHRFLSYSIAVVWLINGAYCKLFNFVPRHQEIVSRILGDEHAFLFTKSIGICEVSMALWIISSKYTRISAITQISVVTAMNILEYILVPDLLLWGKANALFAFAFVLVVYFNEFRLGKRQSTNS